MRAVGNRTGTVRQYVAISDINAPHLQVANPSTEGFNLKELMKYRKLYRKGKEEAWPALPLIGWWQGRMVIDDGSHRMLAAVLEGATQVLVDLEPEPKKGKKK